MPTCRNTRTSWISCSILIYHTSMFLYCKHHILSYSYRMYSLWCFFAFCDFPCDDYDPVFYLFLMLQSLCMCLYLTDIIFFVCIDACVKWWQTYWIGTIKNKLSLLQWSPVELPYMRLFMLFTINSCGITICVYLCCLQ